MKTKYKVCIFFVSFVCISAGVIAHEARPAYFELTELSSGSFTVIFRNPIVSDSPLPIEIVFQDMDVNLISSVEEHLPGELLEKRIVSFRDFDIKNQRIDFKGLSSTSSNVLVRVNLLNQNSYSQVITPDKPWLVVSKDIPAWKESWSYARLGFEHIIKGYDHLLFILALVFLIGSWRKLVATITAFTVAHSVSLAAVTFGLVTVSSPAVEVVIALSVVFLAREIIQVYRGKTSLTNQFPWLVVLVFGLLHGLGFAGALGDIGLPSNEIPFALLMFNLGVELGQLAFIAIVLLLVNLWKRLLWPLSSGFVQFPAYMIGGVSVFWLIERTFSL